MAATHVAEALWLRRRARRLTALADARSTPPAESSDAEDVRFVLPSDAKVDARTAAAASRELVGAGDVVVLDLVPGDLPGDRALRLLRRVDPARLGTDPFYTPGGAHEVLALGPDVTSRLPANLQQPESGDRGDQFHRTVEAQRCAPTATALCVAPDLRARPLSAEDRWRELEARLASAWPYGALAPILVALETLHLVAMTGGLLVAPGAAAAAALTWSGQPAIALGTVTGPRPALASPRLGRASLTRLPRAWADNVRTIVAGVRATRAREARRARTPVPDPPPDHVLFGPRRSTCPWCGSSDLAGRLDVTDLLQHKPGRFHLDECRDCDHIFQNPGLTPTGLDHYYEHAYDGIGDALAEASFAALAPIYHRRVETLAAFTEPRAWLDVGTGHGHFPLAARQRWPELVIDGLDMSATVDDAARRGRIDTAYRGSFPDLADGLPRSYDVVSMHHYVEHTVEPRRELAAAAKLLEPGGHLMIEMPDPASPWARRLGRFWWQWGQPQHQHFVSCENMVDALRDHGFEVLMVEKGPATMGGELFNAVGLVLQALARSPHLPWLRPLGWAHRARRVALFTAALPAMVVAKAADEIKDARLRRPGTTTPGNAYRIVARRS